MHATDKQIGYAIDLMSKYGWLVADAVRPESNVVLREFAAAYARKRAKTYIRSLSLADASTLIGELKSL